MRRTFSLNLLLVIAGLAVVGCGGGQSASDDPGDTELADTSGDEAVAPTPEPEPEPEPAPEPEPVSGPGQLTVSNRVGNEDGGGTVQVLDQAGEVVAEGNSGQTFNVESGSYRVRGTIADAAILIDTPTHELDGMVTVPPGQTTTASITFPVSHIRINVRRGNRTVARWRLEIQREGREQGETITLEPSSDHVPITPGRYSGTLRFGGQQIEVSGLIFQGGARMSVPINVN